MFAMIFNLHQAPLASSFERSLILSFAANGNGISRGAIIGISIGVGVLSLAIILGCITIMGYRRRLAIERSVLQPAPPADVPRLNLGGFNAASQMSPAFPSLMVSVWK